MKTKFFMLLAALIGSLAISPAVYAQATGNFSGVVTDRSGSSVSNATVTITSQNTGLTRQTTTDDVGHYLIPLLPVGVYTIHVEFQGFQSVETKDVRLQVDEARELDFALAPSSVSSQVEVTAEAVAVETSNPSLGQVITAQQVTQLPLNGRDFVQLATLTPARPRKPVRSAFLTAPPVAKFPRAVRFRCRSEALALTAPIGCWMAWTTTN